MRAWAGYPCGRGWFRGPLMPLLTLQSAAGPRSRRVTLVKGHWRGQERRNGMERVRGKLTREKEWEREREEET